MTPAELRAAVDAVLAQQQITTCLLFRFDFKSEVMCATTGVDALQVTGHSDPRLNGMTFQPVANGVPVEVGDNVFGQEGSSALQVALALPANVAASLDAAAYHPTEYQGRPVIVWRALLVDAGGPGAAAQWAFLRIRSGTMDTVEITNDGQRRVFTLTIESHQSSISNASGSTYLDQKRFDPADTSQDFAVSSANGSPAPTRGSAGSPVYVGPGGGGGGGGFVDQYYREMNQL